jgi:hypothetical protein
MFINGQKVIVNPAMTPLAFHEGVVTRKTKYGYRVRFNAWGVWMTETFTPSRMQAA